MAQTKRKRPTKHRGNAAGMIEARGRTGRKPTATETRARGGQASTGKGKKEPLLKADRYDSPPTWKASLNRALFASIAVLGLSVVIKAIKPAQALGFLPVVLLIYVPLGFYTDQYIYRRRQRRKAEKK
jgi:hypothetical protein